jgi:plastocyanin
MVNVISKRCAEPGCNKQPTFNQPGLRPKYCAPHKSANMVNVINKRCAEPGCNKQPTFNQPGLRPKYCAPHKSANMVNVIHKRCAEPGCNKHPTCNQPGLRPKYCAQHKSGNMVDVIHKRCAEPGCNKRHTFNQPGLRPKYCAQHKSGNMVDVIHKRCAEPGCNKRHTFNQPGLRPKYCAQHKSANMVDVINKRCAEPGCNKQPVFNQPGLRPKYCAQHKSGNMVDVINKRCANDDCMYRANYSEDKIARFCKYHRTYEMKARNVRLCRKSLTEYCHMVAIYGPMGSPPIHCRQHKKINEIKRPNKKCIICIKSIPQVHTRAVYGKYFKILRCEQHKYDDDHNYVEQKCVSCNLMCVLDEKGKCEYCSPETFLISRLYKQNALMNYLDSIGLPGDSTDRIQYKGICGWERPDRVFLALNFIIIVECDEDQHMNGDKTDVCDLSRMFNIGQTNGGIPIYFIRWNPDDYRTKVNITQSDYVYQKCEILHNRYKLLGNVIKDILQNRISPPNALVSALYMYYDGWTNINNEEWHIIAPFENEAGECISDTSLIHWDYKNTMIEDPEKAKMNQKIWEKNLNLRGGNKFPL